jgi:hypothetical protein
MSLLSSDLRRAALELKLNQVKRATRSYLRDRTGQATGTLAGYAIAAGLYAASGIFLIAASLVGAAALFRWIEIKYGMFWAFGAAGILLLAIAGICAALAASRLHRPAPHFPSLTSRLRVAIKASPVKSGQIDAVRDSPGPQSPSGLRYRPSTRPPAASDSRDHSYVRTGLILGASLLGWAAARRMRQARRPPV